MSGRRSTTGPPFRGPIRWELVPKPGGDVRRLVVLAPADQLAFAGASPARYRPSGGRRIAHRTRTGSSPGTRPRARHGAVDQGEDAVASRRAPSGKGRRFVAVTDVRACYASISPIVLARRLSALGSARDLRRRDRVVAARVRRAGRRRASRWVRPFRRCSPTRCCRRATMRSAARARRTFAGSTTWRSSHPTRAREPRRSSRSVGPGRRSAWRSTTGRPCCSTIRRRRHVCSDRVGCAPASSTLR